MMKGDAFINLAALTIVQGARSCILSRISITHRSCCSAILVLRIWYLYSHDRGVRILTVGIFVLCTTLSFAFLGISLNTLHSVKVLPINGVKIIGCSAPPPQGLWKVFVPSLVLHTYLYLLTTYKTLKETTSRHSAPLRMRFLREYVFILPSLDLDLDNDWWHFSGGLFYSVVFSKTSFRVLCMFFSK